MAKHLRPRPSSIDMLPVECEGVVAWAAQELARSGRTMTDVYEEFKRRLIAIQGELGLGFDIPALSSFGRHSLRLSNLNRRNRRAVELSRAVNENTDETDADELTKAAAMTLKTLIVELLEYAGEAGFSPKEAMAMSGAIKQLAQAENISTARRQKVQQEFKDKAEKIIDTVAKEKGMSAEIVAQLRRDFLGVRDRPKGES